MTSPAAGLPGLRMRAEHSDARIVLIVMGELDIATSGAFVAAIQERLGERPLLLDLRELSFIDSSGVHAIDGIIAQADREDAALSIHPDLHDHVRQVLEMTGMMPLLPLAAP